MDYPNARRSTVPKASRPAKLMKTIRSVELSEPSGSLASLAVSGIEVAAAMAVSAGLSDGAAAGAEAARSWATGEEGTGGDELEAGRPLNAAGGGDAPRSGNGFVAFSEVPCAP